MLISLALHATALHYPVFFSASRSEQLFPVIVLSPGAGENGAPKRAEDNRTNNGQNHATRHRLIEPRVQTNDAVKPDGQEERKVDLGLIAAPASVEDVPVTSNQTDGETAPEAVSLGFAGLGGDVREGPGDVKGDGGNGVGVESGIGGAARAVGLVGVSYAYTPKPIYPDIARREGREGTVVLSVLVGEDGTSKSLALNRSSGSEALDKAATDTVRRWRFHAARDGDKRIETWVNVPIVFRLADLKH